ncbi:MAG: hypothetical protein JRJ02_01550 [Deltaproteobacteria bacterium]|nr:hypothetical protein [Deltaproteobacteria bacterium]MBW1861043.1 hypothetical protein [Deltaproteobacteria bacterium]
MATQRKDVVQLLSEEKAYHIEQIKRINMALDVLKRNITTLTSHNVKKRVGSKTILWMSELTELFNENIKLSIDDICDKLTKKGFTEVLEKRSSIYATISKMVKKGVIKKIGYGQYRKIKKEEKPYRNIDTDISP